MPKDEPGRMAILFVFSGLPATGKSSIARTLAAQIGAVWLRIDSIEQAIRDAGTIPGSLNDTGYRAAYAVAEDNLRLGHDVIADCVNPWMLTRDAWRDAGLRAGARLLEIETVCSDPVEHRCRVESRTSDIAGQRLPNWADVTNRDYHAWTRDHLTLDTARLSLAACVEAICVSI